MRKNPYGIAISLMLAFILVAQPEIAQSRKVNPGDNPINCALFVAQKLDPEERIRKGDSLAYIAFKYWELGQYELALHIAHNTKCYARTYVSISLADRALRAGLKDYAKKFIDQFLLCTKDEDFYQQRLLVECVEKLLKLQQYEKAATVADTIEDETSKKALAFALVAKSFIKTNRGDNALVLLDRASAQAMKSDEDFKVDRCEALSEIAACYALLGKSDKALSTLSLAKELAEKEDAVRRDDAKRAVAIGYLETGYDADGYRLAESLALSWRVDTYISFSSKYLQKGQKTTAQNLLAKLVAMVESENDYENNKSRYLFQIAKAYLDAGMPEEAIRIAGKIRYDYYLSEAAIAIADWSLKHRRSNLAVEALDIARNKLKLIISEKREEILPQMSSSRAREKASYLSAISDKYIEAGKFNGAEDSIKAIDLPQWKALKIADLAMETARTSSKRTASTILDEALQLSKTSREYPHDILQETALGNIARGYSEAGKKRLALDLFAQVIESISNLETYDDRINRLVEVSFSFERAGLKADQRIMNVLHKILETWVED